MKKIIMIIFTMTISLFIISSCEKESEEDTKKDIPQVELDKNDTDTDKNDTDTPDNNNSNISEEGEGNSTGNSPSTEKKYVVRGWTTRVELSRYAKNETIELMAYNGPWRAEYKGNITGFVFSPSIGSGNVVLNIAYAETKYESTKAEIAWNESGYITVYVREGTESNWTERSYLFPIRRYGRKMNV